MGEAKTTRPFRSRKAVCSSKSISTEVCARNETATQKKVESAIAILTRRLNPRGVRKSRGDFYAPHNLD
jgi:hypothetical protein